jgi:hypothetical protein
MKGSPAMGRVALGKPATPAYAAHLCAVSVKCRICARTTLTVGTGDFEMARGA